MLFLMVNNCYYFLQAMKFRTGKGQNVREIDVNACYESLDPKRSESLLAFHVFTGCDQTGRICGKSKSTWWDHFMKAGNEVLNAFTKLGIREDLPTLETLEILEGFVVTLYGGLKHPQNINSLSDLRWYLFSKFQQEAEKLLPTFGALKYKIFRAHFVTMGLRRSHLTIQGLPPAIDYGWENVDAALVPLLTDSLPAPLALIELSSCSCKSSCTSNKCKCRKNGFICTDLCKCLECRNNDSEDEDIADDNDIHLNDTDDEV